MNHKQINGIIKIFIRDGVFQNVGVSWLIQSNYQTWYDCDKYFPCVIKDGTWYDTMTCPSVYGSSFKYFLLWYVKKVIHWCVHLMFMTRFGVYPLILWEVEVEYQSKNVQKWCSEVSLCHSQFIVTWLKTLENKYVWCYQYNYDNMK